MDDLSPTDLKTIYVAHPDFKGKQHQSVKAHLWAVSELAGKLSKKVGFEKQGQLIGLMHDFGKYSSAFQNYMRLIITEQTGYNPDNDEGSCESPTSKSLKGKINLYKL